jgi:hypothetical protein
MRCSILSLQIHNDSAWGFQSLSNLFSNKILILFRCLKVETQTSSPGQHDNTLYSESLALNICAIIVQILKSIHQDGHRNETHGLVYVPPRLDNGATCVCCMRVVSRKWRLMSHVLVCNLIATWNSTSPHKPLLSPFIRNFTFSYSSITIYSIEEKEMNKKCLGNRYFPSEYPACHWHTVMAIRQRQSPGSCLVFVHHPSSIIIIDRWAKKRQSRICCHSNWDFFVTNGLQIWI